MANFEDYEKVDVLQYLVDRLKYNSIAVEEATKKERVYVREGKVGDSVEVILEDGTVAVETVKIDDQTGEPEWIVTNIESSEQKIMSQAEVKKEYVYDEQGVLKPRDGDRLVARVDENITFNTYNPSYGYGDTIISLQAGDYIVINYHNYAVTGLDAAEFEKEYRLAPGEVHSFTLFDPTISRDELDDRLPAGEICPLPWIEDVSRMEAYKQSNSR